MTIAKIVNYYAVVFFYYAPHIYYAMDPSLREKCLSFPGKWCPHRGRHDSESLCVVNSLRVVNVLRLVFLVRRGPLRSYVDIPDAMRSRVYQKRKGHINIVGLLQGSD